MNAQLDQEVVFIASLSHSGSTILDLVLGAHDRFVGLGELFRLLQSHEGWLERTQTERCSCGQVIDRCAFWGGVVPELRQAVAASLGERYAIVLRHFRRAFGERVLVDSSKYVSALQGICSAPSTSVKVLHLVRDVRSWSTSALDRDGRRTGMTNGTGNRSKTGGHFRLFLTWYRANHALDQAITGRELPALVVGYEELAMQPRTTLDRICKFLGVEFDERMLTPKNSGSHSILGNRLRAQPEKLEGLAYDSSWLARRGWVLPAALLPPVMRYNAATVYGSGRDVVWSR